MKTVNNRVLEMNLYNSLSQEVSMVKVTVLNRYSLQSSKQVYKQLKATELVRVY